MTSTVLETVFGLAEIVWMMVIASALLLTIPLWFIPYTIYRMWRKTND